MNEPSQSSLEHDLSELEKMSTDLTRTTASPPASPPPAFPRQDPVARPRSSYAGFWMRVGAEMIDAVVVSFVLSLLMRVGLGLYGIGFQVISLILGALYVIGLESQSGQTLGARALGIKVVTETGTLVPPGRLTLRYAVRFLSYLCLFLGYLWIAWDPRKQAWHDKAAHTYVIILKRPARIMTFLAVVGGFIALLMINANIF